MMPFDKPVALDGQLALDKLMSLVHQFSARLTATEAAEIQQAAANCSLVVRTGLQALYPVEMIYQAIFTEVPPLQHATGPSVHILKCWPPFFEQVESGVKTFEVRRADRPYRVGDILILREWNPESSLYTGREVKRTISYVLFGTPIFGIANGFNVLGIVPFLEETTPPHE